MEFENIHDANDCAGSNFLAFCTTCRPLQAVSKDPSLVETDDEGKSANSGSAHLDPEQFQGLKLSKETAKYEKCGSNITCICLCCRCFIYIVVSCAFGSCLFIAGICVAICICMNHDFQHPCQAKLHPEAASREVCALGDGMVRCRFWNFFKLSVTTHNV